MGTHTNIEWADATWNPWTGCTRVSEGCVNCYMYRDANRYGKDPANVVRSSERTFRMPLSRKRVPPGSFVFVCSWADFFHEDVPNEWRMDALNIMAARPDVVFLILTKRIERVAGFDVWRGEATSGDEPANVVEETGGMSHVWLGATAENQERADERIPQLLSAAWQGPRFVSVEPMLGPIDLERTIPCGYYCDDTGPGHVDHGPNGRLGRIDWVICGGESGPNARPVHPGWVRSLRDQCTAAGVPFMFKQWGEWAPFVDESRYTHNGKETHRNAQGYINLDGSRGWVWIPDDESPFQNWVGTPRDDLAIVNKVGRARAGRALDGREWLERPVVEVVSV